MTASHKLSGSKVSLAISCGYSFRPDVQTIDRASGLPARIGTGAHGHVEDWFHGRPLRELEKDVADKASRIAKSMIAWLEPRRERILYCEVGLRYDTDNDRAEIGPKRGEPGYSEVGRMILPMTLDLAMRGLDGVLEVIDIKTGQKKYVHEEQVDAQGLALARLLGEKQARVGFIYPRLTKCDEPELRPLDERTMDLRAGQLYAVMHELPTSQPMPGDWCWRCDARLGCPAYGETRAADGARELEEAGYFG